MSEDKTQETSAPVEAKEEVKQEQPKTESKSFTQEQLDNIVQARLMAERKKYERKMEEEEKQKTELLKQKQLEEAKSKAEIEKLMKERIAEKDSEISRYKNEIKKEKIERSKYRRLMDESYNEIFEIYSIINLFSTAPSLYKYSSGSFEFLFFSLPRKSNTLINFLFEFILISFISEETQLKSLI